MTALSVTCGRVVTKEVPKEVEVWKDRVVEKIVHKEIPVSSASRMWVFAAVCMC